MESDSVKTSARRSIGAGPSPSPKSWFASLCLHGTLVAVAFGVPYAVLRGAKRERPATLVALAPPEAEPVTFEAAEPERDVVTDTEPEALPEVVPAKLPPEPLPPDPELESVELDPFALTKLPLETLVRPPRQKPDPELEKVEETLPEPQPIVPAEPVGADVPDTAPVVIPARSPDPEYPARALKRRLSGSVLCRITVAADGRVTRVAVEKSSGHALLDDAALAGIRDWRFRPGTRGGKPVEMNLLHRVTFRNG